MTGSVCLSIVVPVYRDWDEVETLLDALGKQTLKSKLFEVILVANDGGPPVKLDLDLPNLKLLTCAKPGSYAARNVGWRQAEAKRIVFTDADCIPDAEWLEALNAAASQAPDALIAGDVVVLKAPDGGLFADYDHILGLPQRTYVQRGYAVTANLSIPVETLKRLDGFTEDRFSGGDHLFCQTALKAGSALHFAPEAQVAHPPRTTFGAHFAKLRRQRGAQIASGSRARRLKYLVRTSLPPLRRSLTLIKSNHSVPMRLRAGLALYLLWLAGFGETVRLLCGGRPVR